MSAMSCTGPGVSTAGVGTWLRDEGGGTRTHDLGIKSPLLYQLSYAPVRPSVSATETYMRRPGTDTPGPGPAVVAGVFHADCDFVTQVTDSTPQRRQI